MKIFLYNFTQKFFALPRVYHSPKFLLYHLFILTKQLSEKRSNNTVIQNTESVYPYTNPIFIVRLALQFPLSIPQLLNINTVESLSLPFFSLAFKYEHGGIKVFTIFRFVLMSSVCLPSSVRVFLPYSEDYS